MYGWIVAGVIVLIWLWNSLFKVKEGERGIVLRLGQIKNAPLEPGWRFVWWPVEALYRISVEPQTVTIGLQELVASGDAPIKAGATCTFRVVDAGRAIAESVNFLDALRRLAVERMRQTVGQSSADEVVYAPAAVNEQIRRSLEETAREWGLEILSFEIVVESH